MVHNVDLLSNPKEAFWKLSAPFILLSLFEACYSFVDLFWVSQMNQEAFFAIGVCVPLVSLLSSFGSAIGNGTNSLISRELGKGDYEATYNSILHGLVACTILGIIFALSTFYLKDILALMNVTESVDLAIAYLTPIFSCSFIYLFSNLFVSTLQAEGNSRTPTILLILTNIMNLILDPIFIFVLNLGVAGVSYSSILATLGNVIIMLYWYLSGKSQVVLSFRYFKPGIVYDIFVVAVPNFIIHSLGCFTTMYINKILISQLGQIGILLYSTSTRIESMMVSPLKAFGKSLLSITGQLYGAREFGKLNDTYTYVLKISMGIAFVFALVFFFIRDYGFSLFSVTGMETSVFYIALVGIFLVPCEEVIVMSSKVLDGLGRSYHALTITILTIITQVILITLLEPVLTSGVCVLVGIFLSELIFSLSYYIIVKYLFKLEGKDIIKHPKIAKNA